MIELTVTHAFTEPASNSPTMVLVLDSGQRHLGWRLAVVGARAQSLSALTVVLSRGSRVVSSNVEVNRARWFEAGPEDGLESLVDVARARFGAVTLAATVQGANRVSVLLSSDGENQDFLL